MGDVDSVYQTFIDYAKLLGITVFLFSAQDIKTAEGKIIGYTWENEAELKSNHYPIPSVIYNRCYGKSRQRESTILLKILERFPQTKVFNQSVDISVADFAGNFDIKTKLKPDSLFLGRPFKIMVLMQKNAKDTWTFSGGVLVLAKENVYPLFPALKELSPEKYSIFSQELLNACWNLIRDLNNKNYLLGEIMIQVAIDSSGRLYLSGINTLPTKKEFKALKDKVLISLTQVKPLLYAASLGGMNINDHPWQHYCAPQHGIFCSENNAHSQSGVKITSSHYSYDISGIDLTNTPTGESTKLFWGNWTTSVKLMKTDIPEKNDNLLLRGHTLSGLSLPQDRLLTVKKKDEHLFLGPIIGILENNDEIQHLEKQNPYPNQVSLAQAALKHNCLFYHFCPRDVDLQAGRIQGWYYNSNKDNWEKGLFPLPEIIYDRAVFGDSQELDIAKEVRTYLRHLPVRFLNTKSVFGKGETLETLSTFPDLKSLIPQTLYMPDRNMLEKFITENLYVFVKTEQGQERQGVFKITAGDNLFELERYDLEPILHNTNFSYSSDLLEHISQIVSDKSFIVQQGIKVPEYDSSPLNIRVIIQKDGTGFWAQPLIIPWVAQNAERTGYCLSWNKTMPKVYSSTHLSNRLYHKLKTLSYKVAMALESRYGELGELGIDFVADQQATPWLIEVNGKTSKFYFVQSESQQIKDMIFENPIAYAKFLAGYNNG